MSLTDFAVLAMARLLKSLPPAWASGLGAGLGHLYGLQAHCRGQLWTARICENFRRLTGETDPRRLRRLMLRNLANSGRTTAEITFIRKLEPHLAFEGLERLKELHGPAILLFPHLGNWEIASYPFISAGRSLTAIYAPPRNAAVHRLAIEARRSAFAGAPDPEFIPASPSAARDLFNAARSGRDLLIAIDEERDGLVWNPPFGRCLPLRGNRMLAARLARRFGHALVPVSAIRRSGLDHDIVVHPPIPVPQTADPRADIHAAADRISDVFEDLIRRHLDQWYWLGELRLDRPFPAHLYEDVGAAGGAPRPSPSSSAALRT